MSDPDREQRPRGHMALDAFDAWCDRVLFADETDEKWPRSRRPRRARNAPESQAVTRRPRARVRQEADGHAKRTRHGSR